MPLTDTTTLARSLYDLFNGRKFDNLTAIVAREGTLTDMATGITFRGPAGFRQFMEGWVRALPDCRVKVKRIHAGDNFAVVEFEGTGTHTGPLTTPAGDVPATHHEVREQCCDVHEFKDGKIVNSATYYDWSTMMRQLGTLPEPAHA